MSEAGPTGTGTAEDVTRRRHVWAAGPGPDVEYEAVARTLLVRDDDERPLASVFAVAYLATSSAADGDRPLTFCFNGGPGSASLWLNIGGFGPRRAPTRTPEATPPAPYRVVDNPHSLLDVTDRVFVDAVGTGYSRAAEGVPPERVWGVDQDVDVVARAVQRYLTLTGSWNRPRFLFGESYGTMRAAALAHRLQNQGLDLNGVVLLSAFLDAGTARGDQGHVHLLPSYAATAWYHGLLPERGDLETLLDRARTFAAGPYAHALQLGDRMSAEREERVAAELHDLTGLDVALLRRRHLRVGMEEFRAHLRAADGLVVGRFDTRFTAPTPYLPGEGAVDPATDDPATAGVTSAHLSAFRAHLAHDVGHRSDLTYRPLHNTVIEPVWDWRHRAPGTGEAIAPADVAPDLAAALRRNPHLQVAVLGGVFDLATPFFGVESDVARLYLGARLRANVRFHLYESGHMTFVDEAAATAMAADLRAFYRDAAPADPPGTP